MRTRASRALSVLLGACVALGGARLLRASDPADATGSGIEVVGPEDEEFRPERWTAVDPSGREVARVERKWGFAPLPAGRYELRVLPRGYQAMEVSWGTVTVADGAPTRVEVRSGIDLRGRTPDDEEPEHWDVTERTGGRKVAHVYRRWGFTPLPPGEYSVTLRPKGHLALEVPWKEVAVGPGAAVRVDVRTGIDLVPRSPEDEEMDDWEVADARSGRTVAHVYRRWGFTPLPPGEYAVRLRPKGHEALPLPWTTTPVVDGPVTVRLDSGVEMTGRPGEAEMDWWWVDDAGDGKPVAKTYRRWGFTPVPPGRYRVRIRPQGHEAVEVVWSEVEVAPKSTASVVLDSGIELPGGAGEEPPERWTVVEAGTREPRASVWRRWGFTPLPPGRYEVLQPPHRWPDVEVVAGRATRLETPDLDARWAQVTGQGRPAERTRDPEAWRRLEEEVERAIRRAAAWLKRHPRLENLDPAQADDYPTLGVLALVHAGELKRDPALAARAVDYLLRRPLNKGHATYATSLTAMALRDLGALRYRGRVFECAQWLVENQGWEGEAKAWSYGQPVPGHEQPKPAGALRAPRGALEVERRGVIAPLRPQWDNSNVQFAVLGLHAATGSRITIPRRSWERVEAHFREVQDRDGGWGYGTGGSYGSMTCAGIASLLIARHHLGAERPSHDPDVVRGLEWLDWRFTVEENPDRDADHLYFLYGLERVGVLAGTEFVGEHEWYPTGARRLLAMQRGDGSWLSEKYPPTGASHDYLDTCYAILFLRRATLPLETTMPATLRVRAGEDETTSEVGPAVELIFDSSDSMKEAVGGRPKVDVARAVLLEVLDGLPAEMRVGLRLYGHRGVWVLRRDDPRAGPVAPNDPRLRTDSELVVPIGPLDDERRSKIRKWLEIAQPRGITPLVYSLLQARHDFPGGDDAPRTVVLVSDGQETAGGRLEDVAAAYRGSGIEVKIHVVGFDVAGTEAQRQLEQIARIGKGRYYAARDGRELADALKTVVEPPGFEVLAASGGEVVARGMVGGDPVELEPGSYRVRLAGASGEGVAVTLKDGEEAEIAAPR